MQVLLYTLLNGELQIPLNLPSLQIEGLQWQAGIVSHTHFSSANDGSVQEYDCSISPPPITQFDKQFPTNFFSTCQPTWYMYSWEMLRNYVLQGYTALPLVVTMS